MPLGEPVDEDELEQDLANLEQEKLDEQMLDTGPGKVPQGDKIEGLNEGKSRRFAYTNLFSLESRNCNFPLYGHE